jgi:glycosyltransferase involved in cell wall biosynthesis
MCGCMLQRVTSAKPLHVLVATPAAATGQGGIDRVMAGLKGELARQGVADIEAEFRATRGGGHIAFAAFYLASFLMRMLVLRAAGRLDLVHINLSTAGSTLRKLQVARLCRWLGVPYAIHLHGGSYPKFWKDDGSRLSRAILEMFNDAAIVLVLGEVWRQFVTSRAPEAADRIVVVPNAAANPTLPHTGGGDKVHILFLGRLNAAKGAPQLGEALYRMRDIPLWRATLAGDGSLEEARAKAGEMGLVDRVDLPGWVDGPGVAELIASADILVLPSFIENLPLSIIEGMASGLAVVATPVGAVEDIISDGNTGLLVQPGDVDSLTAALTRLVGDPALRAKLGAAAKAVHTERLELGAYARTMSRLWRDAITVSRERHDATGQQPARVGGRQ